MMLRLQQGKIPDDIPISVQQRAQGVFLWAVLITQIFKKDCHRGNIHNLRSRLHNLPDGLHSLSHEMIHRGADGEDDGDERTNLLSILRWIAFASKPLTPPELYFAVRSGQSDFDASLPWERNQISSESMKLFILNCSKGLAELTTGKNPITPFIHESMKDYLQETGLAVLTPKLDETIQGSAHDHLKHCCLQRMSIKLIRVPSGPCVVTSTDFPFLEYSLNNIFHHAELASVNGVSQLDFVKNFPLSTWRDIRGALGILGPFGPLSRVFIRECAKRSIRNRTAAGRMPNTIV